MCLATITRGDPSILLKSINPLEAHLFDAASNVHVRFRLGGERFPPLIYYRIYTHGPVCDVGSYAPRNYAKIKRDIKKEEINISQVNQMRPLTEEQLEAEINEAGWYVRQENNGWRPISEKILRAYDPVEFATANRPKVFHFNKYVRKKLTEQQKRKVRERYHESLAKIALAETDVQGCEEGGSGDGDEEEGDAGREESHTIRRPGVGEPG